MSDWHFQKQNSPELQFEFHRLNVVHVHCGSAFRCHSTTWAEIIAGTDRTAVASRASCCLPSSWLDESAPACTVSPSSDHQGGFACPSKKLMTIPVYKNFFQTRYFMFWCTNVQTLCAAARCDTYTQTDFTVHMTAHKYTYRSKYMLKGTGWLLILMSG
jgi:hypothetical protein